MIFAQYKNAITFAVVILGLAVVVADPGADRAADGQETVAAPPAETAANLAPPAAAQQAAPAEADPEWYGASGENAPADDIAPQDDGGYNVGSAGRSTPAPMQGRPVASAPAPAPTYVPPPPPPQVPPGG